MSTVAAQPTRRRPSRAEGSPPANSNLGIFFRDIRRKHRTYTSEEERELFLASKACGESAREAREALIFSVLPFALKVAKDSAYRSRDTNNETDLEERVSVACQVVLRCVDQFDPDRGRLTTLVGMSVKNALCSWQPENQGVIHVPSYTVWKRRKGTLREDIRRAADRANAEFVSLQQSHRDDSKHHEGDPREFNVDLPGDDRSIAELIDDRQLISQMFRALNRLQRPWRVVLKRRAAGQGIQQIAQRMGLTKQRIRQIEERALQEVAYLLGLPPENVRSIAEVGGKRKHVGQPG